jgi:transposase InsO family protein
MARSTVQRLMKRLGLRGVIRGKIVRTTVSDANASCPLDHVRRPFRADRPNALRIPCDVGPRFRVMSVQ